MLEFAIVGSLTFLLLLGLVIGGLGIFRYQQVASLSREASRWASVHGAQYADDTGNSPATATDVYNHVILPQATSLDLSKLRYSVTWNTSNSQFHTKTVNGATVKVANTVTVTVIYQWIPEAFLRPITLSSTSVAVMSY
jgi:Flp pilus assembly protein TadG